MENYQATSNLHLQEFGTTISKGSIVTLDGNKLTCGPLEGEIGNSFRIFVRSGALVKVDESVAKEAQASSGAVTYKARPESEKMPLVNADINRIEIKDVAKRPAMASTEEKKPEDSPTVRGMKVEEHETIDIGTKVKDIPTTSKGIETKKTGDDAVPLNKVKERPKDPEAVKKAVEERRQARLKEAAEIEAELEKKEAKAEKTKTAKVKKEAKTDEPIELNPPEGVPAEPEIKEVKTVKKPGARVKATDDVAEAEAVKIKLPPSVNGVVSSKSREPEVAEQAKFIKIK